MKINNLCEDKTSKDKAIRGGRQEDALLRVISGLAMTGWRWARVPRLVLALSARRAAIPLMLIPLCWCMLKSIISYIGKNIHSIQSPTPNPFFGAHVIEQRRKAHGRDTRHAWEARNKECLSRRCNVENNMPGFLNPVFPCFLLFANVEITRNEDSKQKKREKRKNSTI